MMMDEAARRSTLAIIWDNYAQLEKLIADFLASGKSLSGPMDNLWAMADRDPGFPVAFIANETDMVHVCSKSLHRRVHDAMHTIPWAVEWFERHGAVYPALRLRGTTGALDLAELSRNYGALPPPLHPLSTGFCEAMARRVEPARLRDAVLASLPGNDEVSDGRI